MAGAGPS
ncbi:hypothetical protein Zm00014a_003755 [Zea mays]|nr:hypothetical protein Zm00014a_003755 [Zea mays]